MGVSVSVDLRPYAVESSALFQRCMIEPGTTGWRTRVTGAYLDSYGGGTGYQPTLYPSLIPLYPPEM